MLNSLQISTIHVFQLSFVYSTRNERAKNTFFLLRIVVINDIWQQSRNQFFTHAAHTFAWNFWAFSEQHLWALCLLLLFRQSVDEKCWLCNIRSGNRLCAQPEMILSVTKWGKYTEVTVQMGRVQWSVVPRHGHRPIAKANIDGFFVVWSLWQWSSNDHQHDNHLFAGNVPFDGTRFCCCCSFHSEFGFDLIYSLRQCEWLNGQLTLMQWIKSHVDQLNSIQWMLIQSHG